MSVTIYHNPKCSKSRQTVVLLGEHGMFYVRFMDDWIVLSRNRWKLKKAIQIVNQTLNELKVKKHPDKTFIGRIAKGFDFLGYSFEPKGLSIAPKTLANFLDRMTQLYEQGVDHRRIGKRKGKR